MVHYLTIIHIMYITYICKYIYIRFNKGIQYKKHQYFDLCLFQLHHLQYEILQKSNHLQELFVINIFPLDILNHERN